MDKFIVRGHKRKQADLLEENVRFETIMCAFDDLFYVYILGVEFTHVFS